jgi:Ser/Thr protein kinase RdoA (MazF antagonist)
MTDRLPPEVARTLDRVLRLSIGQGPSRPRIIHESSHYWIIVSGASDATDVVVKLAAPSATMPSFETALAKHVRIQGLAQVTMATMIAADDSCQHVPLRYCVQSRLQGRIWFEMVQAMADTDRAVASGALGDMVGRLHQPMLPAFGALLDPKEPECQVALMDHARAIIPNKKHCDQYIGLLTRNPTLWSGLAAGITHDDLHGYNILVRADGHIAVSGLG